MIPEQFQDHDQDVDKVLACDIVYEPEKYDIKMPTKQLDQPRQKSIKEHLAEERELKLQEMIKARRQNVDRYYIGSEEEISS